MKKFKLAELIGSGLYAEGLAKIKQAQKDKGYTDEWLKEAVYEFNREWCELVRVALVEHNGVVQQKLEKYTAVKSANFNHNYTERDFADLQFLQTLIKTRILNECAGQPVWVERVLNEFINTQAGARAIMFLSNDNEVGKAVKPFYIRAAENAQSVAEKRFNESKAAKLEELDRELTPLQINSVIGNAMLKQAEERVNSDWADQAADYYFGCEGAEIKEPLMAGLGQN